MGVVVMGAGEVLEWLTLATACTLIVVVAVVVLLIATAERDPEPPQVEDRHHG